MAWYCYPLPAASQIGHGCLAHQAGRAATERGVASDALSAGIVAVVTVVIGTGWTTGALCNVERALGCTCAGA